MLYIGEYATFHTMHIQNDIKEKQTHPVQKHRLILFFIYVWLISVAIATIMINPWIFFVTTVFLLAMFVILSLASLIFFGIPIVEYSLLKKLYKKVIR